MEIPPYVKRSHNPSEKLIFQACIKALGISCENMLTRISSVLVYVQKCITIKAKIVHSPLGLWINLSIGSSYLHWQGQENRSLMLIWPFIGNPHDSSLLVLKAKVGLLGQSTIDWVPSLQKQTLTFSHFWGLEVLDSGVGRIWLLLRPLSLTCRHPSSPVSCVFTGSALCICVLIPLFYGDSGCWN